MLTAAGLWAVNGQRDVPTKVTVAVVGIALAAVLVRKGAAGASCGLALAAGGGWLVATAPGVPEVTWARVLVAITASLGALVVARFERVWGHDAPGLALLAVTIGGVYLCVPDTEEIGALASIALPFAVLGWPLRLATLGESGAAAAVCLLTWVDAVGGRGRPASIVGAIGGLALLAGVPIGSVVAPQLRMVLGAVPRSVVIVGMGAAHLALVLTSARLGGLRSDPVQAALIVFPVAIAAIVIGALCSPVERGE